jgi:hypothetical protein
MPRRGQISFGEGNLVVLIAVWKIILSYLMWCIWTEKNDQSFEDNKKTVVKLKGFFNTQYQWMAANECFYISSFHNLFYLLSFFG